MKEKKCTVDFDSIGFFNFARGIGIIYVLLGHSILLLYPLSFNDHLFGNFFSIFGGSCMALFFMISGYGFRRRKMWKCMKTQAKFLLKPYWITVGCVIGAKLVLALVRQRSFWEFGGQYIFSYLFAINRGVDGGYKGRICGLAVDNVAMLWFFWALFGGWILCNAITRIKSRKRQYVLAALSVCIGIGMTYVSDIWPFVLPHMFQAAGFIFMGYMVWEHRLIERQLPIWLYIAAGCAATVSFMWGGVDIYTCVWKLGLLDYLGITALGFLMMRFFVWMAGCRKRQAVYDFISGIGGKTLLILCIHAFDEKVLPWHRLGPLFEGYYWLGCIVAFIIRCVFIFTAYQVVHFINMNFIRKWRRKRKSIRLDIQS